MRYLQYCTFDSRYVGLYINRHRIHHHTWCFNDIVDIYNRWTSCVTFRVTYNIKYYADCPSLNINTWVILILLMSNEYTMHIRCINHGIKHNTTAWYARPFYPPQPLKSVDENFYVSIYTKRVFITNLSGKRGTVNIVFFGE